MRSVFRGAAALGTGVAVLVAVTVPPRRLSLAAFDDGTIPGVIHIHTNRSDGLGTPDEIAATAARAGLKFIVFTDHGDATRAPDPPAYRSGVLCLDAVEVSTTSGHYIAIDMPRSPYPLGGEARDVIDDVHRLGGFGIAAHPDSPKFELRWREWAAPFDGIELVNPDTTWRVWAARPGWRPRLRLLAALVDYPFRPAETIASLIEEPVDLPARWAALTKRRRIVTVAGADAHARIAPRNADPGDARFALPFPGYEASFRVLSVHVRPDRPLSGNAAEDGPLVARAIRSGHLHSAIDGIATPASLEFTATNASGTAHEGDELALGGPVTLRVRSNAPPTFTTMILDGTNRVGEPRHEQEFSVTLPDKPAVYSVAIMAGGRAPNVPWLRSNAIYVRGREPLTVPRVRPPARAAQVIFDGKTATGWHIEHDPTSLAAVDVTAAIGGNELLFRFGVSGQVAPAPYVALGYDTPGGIAAHDRLTFTIRAERPMRVSVQLRASATDGQGPRWQRSIYVDTGEEERTVYFADLGPIETDAYRPPPDAIRSVLFVVDPVNTKRGTSGRIWIKHAELQR